MEMADILRHTTSFLDEVLSHSDLRHRILSSARLNLPTPLDPSLLQALTLVSQSVQNSPTAEKLLLPLPDPNPLSSLLLSLSYAYRRRHVSGALAILSLFRLDPALARTELAGPVFENLFIPHLLPVIRWYSDRRLAIRPMKSLSRMSGEEAEELRGLERRYEGAMDENCRVYAEYLKKVLEGSDESCPQLVFVGSDEGRGFGEEEEERGEFVLSDGRYNHPMWDEEDRSYDSSRHSSHGLNRATSPTLYPQRVSPRLLQRQPSDVSKLSSTRTDYSFDENESIISTGSRRTVSNKISDTRSAYTDRSYSEDDPELEENNIALELFESRSDPIEDQKQEQPSAESSCSLSLAVGDSDNFLTSGKQNPPKDFVCPITSNIFSDPVTLETGQTYERSAIQEWLDRGNSTCPITRQNLSITQLPKTNYVLKRLIASWQEQNPYSTPPRTIPEGQPLRTPSPTSVISQASIDSTMSDLRLAISQLCTSEVLSESEMSVLKIERYWRETNVEHEILSVLSKPAVINGFVEILFNSVDTHVLETAVYLLAEMSSKDKNVVYTLTRVESDVQCMVALFKKGLIEAVVLIYLLNPSWDSLLEMDMVEALIMTIKSRGEDSVGMCLKPKTASILLLGQILRGDSRIASDIISGRVIERIVTSLEAQLTDERIAAVGILARCMEEDGTCRNMIADKAEIAPVLECLTMVDDAEKFEIVRFLYELVKLRRRSFNQHLLEMIKDEGSYSTMHTLLVYLQTALKDQAPIVSGLLLQLDLLVEPRKMSMYREEAIDALVSSLKDSDSPSTRLVAAKTIFSLQGRFSYSGKPLARAFLLKHAGMNKSFRAIMQSEQFDYALEDSEENLGEEKAADEWERRMAFVLVSHEFGLIFEALSEGLKSKNNELFSACLLSATWLVHMLSVLPEMGIRGAARVCLLKRYISILKSSKNADDKALALLAVRSFLNDSEGMKDITFHVKDILKTMRELKKSSVLAYEMIKILSDGKDSSSDIWNHKELNVVDCSTNGEVLSIVYFKKKIISGHSDGTIKVWGGNGKILDLIQESHEHTKAVTSLFILQPGEKVYSGSLDKTVRVFSWNGGSKLLIPNKHVKCFTLLHGKLYCGCLDNSIQEIDLATGTLATVQAGNRKLLSKSIPVNALQAHDGLLYSATNSLDGAAVKIHNASNYSPVGSLSSMTDVRSMAISADLIYLGCKSGYVDIWSRNKLTRVTTLQVKTYSRVQCMALDDDGDVLVVGTSDGRIQAWGLT